MKKLALLIFAVFVAALLPGRAAAFERSRLENSYNNLQQNMDMDYYAQGAELDRYRAALQKANLCLSDPNAPEKDMEEAYNELKASYVQLFMASFDYTELILLTDLYRELDADAFEEKGFEALTAAFQAAERELNAPASFNPEQKLTRERYAELKQAHINSFTTALKNAYDSLSFAFSAENVTAGQYASFLAVTETFLRKELLKGNLNDLNAALSKADQVLANGGAQAERTEAVNSLSLVLSSLLKTEFDHSSLTDALSQAEGLDQSYYTEASWNVFQERLRAIRNDLSFPILPSETKAISLSEYRKHFAARIQEKADRLQAAVDELVPKELHSELTDLCRQFEGRVTNDDRVQEYAAQLENAVASARRLLGSDSADATELRAALKEVRDAATRLQNAEDYYAQADASAADDQTSYFIAIGAATGGLFLFSLILAVRVSLRKNGKTTWTK